MGEPKVDIGAVLDEFRWTGAVCYSGRLKKPELELRHGGGDDQQVDSTSSDRPCSPVSPVLSAQWNTRRKLIPSSSTEADVKRRNSGTCCELVFDEAAVDKLVKKVQGPNMLERARAKLEAALASKAKQSGKRKVSPSQNKVRPNRIVKQKGRGNNTSATRTIESMHADTDSFDMYFGGSVDGETAIEEGQHGQPGPAMARVGRTQKKRESTTTVRQKGRQKKSSAAETSEFSHADGDVISLGSPINAEIFVEAGLKDKAAIEKGPRDSPERRLESARASQVGCRARNDCAGSCAVNVDSAGRQREVMRTSPEPTSAREADVLANPRSRMMAGTSVNSATGDKVQTCALVSGAVEERQQDRPATEKRPRITVESANRNLESARASLIRSAALKDCAESCAVTVGSAGRQHEAVQASLQSDLTAAQESDLLANPSNRMMAGTPATGDKVQTCALVSGAVEGRQQDKPATRKRPRITVESARTRLESARASQIGSAALQDCTGSCAVSVDSARRQHDAVQASWQSEPTKAEQTDVLANVNNRMKAGTPSMGDKLRTCGLVSRPLEERRQDKPATERRPRITVESARRKLESARASQIGSAALKVCAGSCAVSVGSSGRQHEAVQASWQSEPTTAQESHVLANANNRIMAGTPVTGDQVRTCGLVSRAVEDRRQDKPATERRPCITVESARIKLESARASQIGSAGRKDCAGSCDVSGDNAASQQGIVQETGQSEPTSAQDVVANANSKMMDDTNVKSAMGDKVRTRASVTTGKAKLEAAIASQQSKKQGSKIRRGGGRKVQPAASAVGVEDDAENDYSGHTFFSSDDETWVITRNCRRKWKKAVKGQREGVQTSQQSDPISAHKSDGPSDVSKMMAATRVHSDSATGTKERPRASVSVAKAKLEAAMASQQSRKKGSNVKRGGRKLKPAARMPLVDSVEDGEDNDCPGHTFFSSDEEPCMATRNYGRKRQKAVKGRRAENLVPPGHPVVEVSKSCVERKTVLSERKAENLEDAGESTGADAKSCEQQSSNPGTAWIPPVSSYGLIQEQLYRDPWKVLVACMLLNQTSGRQMHRVIWTLFELCPTPEKAVSTGTAKIAEVIHSLGLQNKRAKMIQRFSAEYAQGNWTSVIQLHGIGKYAADAHAIFCEGRWREVCPQDHMLTKYWNWLWETDGQGYAFTPDS